MCFFNLSEIKTSIAQAKVFKIEFGRCIDIVFAFNVVAKAFFYEKSVSVMIFIIPLFWRIFNLFSKLSLFTIISIRFFCTKVHFIDCKNTIIIYNWAEKRER